MICSDGRQGSGESSTDLPQGAFTSPCHEMGMLRIKNNTFCDNNHERGNPLSLTQVFTTVPLPAHTMSKRIPLWEDEEGLGLLIA